MQFIVVNGVMDAFKVQGSLCGMDIVMKEDLKTDYLKATEL